MALLLYNAYGLVSIMQGLFSSSSLHPILESATMWWPIKPVHAMGINLQDSLQ